MTGSTHAPTELAPAARRPVRLLVALPALNEERTVGDVVRAVPRDIAGIDDVEIVVIDDGSTDATSVEAERAGARVIHHGSRRGVGAAFHSALAQALEHRVNLLVCLDADGQFDASQIRALVQPVLAGEADFATASRFADPELEPEMPRMKRFGNWVMARLVSRLTGQTFYDVSCGMRCYSRKAALSLHPMGRFTYTQEVFLNLAFKQLRIVEVPMRVRGERQFGESRVAGNLWTYAMRTSGIIFRCYRDYRPMRFFGGAALLFLLPAIGLLGFLAVHYLGTGGFSPYKWTGFAGAALFGMGLVMFLMGVFGDMLNRHRTYLEELLYRERDRQGD